MSNLQNHTLYIIRLFIIIKKVTVERLLYMDFAFQWVISSLGIM